MRNKRNKRGGIGDLISLFTATIVIAIILIGFVVLSGLVKAVERSNTGEKIYKSGDVDIGDMVGYMGNYGRLIRATKRVKDGEVVQDALNAESYSQNAEFVSSYRTIPYLWGVFYGSQ